MSPRFRSLLAALVVTLMLGVTAQLFGTPLSAQELDDELPGAAVPAVPSSVRMEARAGFDGAGRLGGWIPIEVELVNEGAELQAEVQVSVQMGRGRGNFAGTPTTFTLPVVLPRLSHKRFTMEAILPTLANRVTARLVRVPGGELITEREISMLRVPLGDYFCGVLARDPSAYDFIATLDLPPPIRRARTVPLEPVTVPDRAQLLGSFDCLILDNAATSQLRQEQLDAIQVWVGTGGLLIAVGGPTWQSTLGPLPPTLLPVQPVGLANVSSLSAIGELFEVPAEDSEPWLVSQARPLPERGARVVAAQDGVPLIVAAKRGEGTVIYLAFEPTARGLRGWAGGLPLWRYLITHAAVDNGVGSALVRPYLRWGRTPRVALSDFSAHPRPQLDWLWTLSGGYAVLLGGLVLTLGRRGRTGAGVLTVAGLAAGATLLALTLARERAEPDVAVNHLSVVRPIEVGESAAAYTREYLSIFARQDGAFTFPLPRTTLARGMFYPFPRPSDESDADWTIRVSEGGRPALDQVQLAQGQLATAVLDGQVRQAPGVWADLRVEHDMLSGTLANRTGGRLMDAVIVVDNQFHPLGTLDHEQVRAIDLTLPRQAAAGNLAAARFAEQFFQDARTERPGAAARRDLAESLFAARFLFQRMELRGPTLIGWLEHAPHELRAPDLRTSVVDYTLLVQPLQPQLPRGFEGEVPAAAMNRRDLGIGSGLPTDRDYYAVSPGEAITLQFALPPADGTFQLRQLRLNVEGIMAGRLRAMQRPFTVSLFNWRAAEWQDWEVLPGTSSVPDGDRYVSAAGEVRLRYLLDTGQAQTVRETRLTRLDVTPVGLVR